MHGASRPSLAALQEQLSALTSPESVSSDLLGVTALIRREGGLRAALTDPGASPDSRAGLSARLLSGRITDPALELVGAAARSSWAQPRDLADALEILGSSAAFLAAERAGTLDTVEDELFRFGRTVIAEPELRGVLDDTRLDANRKVAILRTLLDGRAQPSTIALLEHLLRNDRGRRFTTGIEQLSALAAERREELVAEVTAAAPLEPEQQQRLTEAVARLYGHERVRLHVVIDPTVLGGVQVRVGAEVIDGTIAARLEQARRQLAS